MTGSVNAMRRPMLVLQLLNSEWHWLPTEFVVDTGFTEYLTLPAQLIQQYGLTYAGRDTITLADGSEIVSHYYIARVRWEETETILTVLEVEGDPLLGMALMHEHRITIEARFAGQVLIEPL